MPKTLRAIMALSGAFAPSDPFLCSAEGDPPGDPGGGDPPEPKFTQADLDRVVQDRVAKIERKYSGFDDIKAKAAQVDDLTAQMADLRQQIEDAGKSAEEKERARAERESVAIKSKLAAAQAASEEAAAKLEAEMQAHRHTRAAHQLATALSQANVHPQASDDALRAFMSESELEFADDGSFAGVTLSNGTRHTVEGLKDAATAFLELKPFYAKGAPGGAGVKPPNGGGPAGGKPLFEQSESDLLAADAAARRAS